MAFNGDLKVEYYLHSDGFAKVTCAVPCPIWMFKTGYTEDKALFKGCVEDETIDVSDASGP